MLAAEGMDNCCIQPKKLLESMISVTVQIKVYNETIKSQQLKGVILT